MFTHLLSAQECPYLYGIHDFGVNEGEFLSHLTGAGVSGWVTATEEIGSNPSDVSGKDFRSAADQGHTVICRLNNGYGTTGTIPPPTQYADFAQRCANFAAATQGCDIFVIGNETNLASEWPVVDGRRAYISPQDYATCFRLCYDAIKTVRPQAKVIPQALAPFAGPYGENVFPGYPHDANQLNWVQYLYQMLTAIKNSGGIDGIALHINSRGYTYNDIHSTNKVSAAGQDLFFSFYVYKDWVDFGIPTDLYHLPLYATECNGIYYWKGGHIENPDAHYEAGWVQEIYAEINRYNLAAITQGKPIFRCVNLYRWCDHCDDWNIDDNPYTGQILSDVDQAAASAYVWPTSGNVDSPPGDNLALDITDWQASSVYNADFGGDKACDGIIDGSSKWTSDGSSPESWLALDVGSFATINGFVVLHANAAGSGQQFNTEAYRLEYGPSLSGPWSVLETVHNPLLADQNTTILSQPIIARFVRLYILDAGPDNYARITEFEVYGTSGSVQQTLVNGDFEGSVSASGVGQGWTPFTSSGYNASFRVTGDQVHGGIKAQQIESPLPASNDQYAGVYQTVSTASGEPVTIRVWNRTQFSGGSDWDYIARLGIDASGGTDFTSSTVQWYEFDSAKESWHMLEKTFTATGPLTTIFLQSWRKWATGGTAFAWFDDVEVMTSQQSAPVADIQATPTQGTAPLLVQFDGSNSYDPEGDPLGYDWDFGDGHSATGTSVGHTYEHAGTYEASLTVTDTQSSSDVATLTITVTSASGGDNLISNGTFDSQLDGWQVWTQRGSVNASAVDARLHLTGADFNGGVYQQFSTGGAGTIISVSGWWQSSPTASDAQWGEVLLINGSDLPQNGSDLNPTPDGSVLLLYKNDTWLSPNGWDGDMDQTSPAANSLSFIASGDVATLVLKTGNSITSQTGVYFDDIQVIASGSGSDNQDPVARIEAGNKNGLIPITVEFDGSLSSDADGDPLTYTWHFGDGTQATGAIVSHTFSNRGSHLVQLVVSDDKGGQGTARTVVRARTRGTGPVDFDAIREQLNQQGQDLAFVKIGFHVAVGGNRDGINDYMTALDDAGVPFCIKTVDDAGIILDGVQMAAASGVPHSLVYRICSASGWNPDVPDYSLTPYAAALQHWQRHRAAFAPELLPYKHLFWIETINEVDKTRAEWVGEFCYHTAKLAMAEGFNWAGPSWSTGEPEPEHWQGPKMKQFLTLAAENPERVAVALHEYSLTEDNLDHWYPYLLGRFQALYDQCDTWSIARPTVLVTEFGWTGTRIAHSVQQAMSTDIPWAAQMYADYPQVESIAIWYLGPGFDNIANYAQPLIAPLTDYALNTYFAVPLEGGNHPPMAAIEADPLEGDKPLTVSFDASASNDPDGDPLSYSWDFGDENSAEGVSVSHTYTAGGSFTAHLTVTDDKGMEGYATQTIHVNDPSQVMGWEVVLEEYFDTYNDWYDQGQQQVRNGWTLWNDSGHNPIGNPTGDEPWNDWAYPEGTFQWAAYIPEQERALFLNERGFCYKIFCGYGAWHSKFIPPQISLDAGTYRMRLGYWADIVDHYDGSTKVPPSGPGSFATKLNFADQQSDWFLAEYLVDNVEAEIFQLETSGDYEISWEFRGPWALQHVGAWIKYFILEKQVPISVRNRPPMPVLALAPEEGTAPLPVQVSAEETIDPDLDDLGITWDFGDGSTASGRTAEHNYINPGLYTITLTVDDGQGHNRSVSRVVRASAPETPQTWMPLMQDYFDTGTDWYEQDNQHIRNGWTMWNDDGTNPIGNPNGVEPWNDWTVPDAGVLTADAMTPEEQALFLNTKGYCYRIHRGWGAWHSRLSTPELSLDGGTYRVRMDYVGHSYTEIVEGVPLPPNSPTALEAQVYMGEQSSAWSSGNALGKNRVESVFSVADNLSASAGFAWRAPWANEMNDVRVKHVAVDRTIKGNIIDNGHPGFTLAGPWQEDSEFGYYGTPAVVSQEAGASVTWSADLSQDGSYKVYARWTSDPSRSEHAMYTIHHSAGQATVKLNQRIDGGIWVELGTFEFTSASTAKITLECESTTQTVSADAVLFELQESPLTTFTYEFPQAGWYMISVPGTATDMRLSTLFPVAASAYALCDKNYVSVTTLEAGQGYWIWVPAPGSVFFDVLPVHQYNRSLPGEGWYMIGGLASKVSASHLGTSPAGAINSQVFAWNAGQAVHEAVSDLVSQKGYWVSVDQACELTLTTSSVQGSVNSSPALISTRMLPPPPMSGITSQTMDVPESFCLQQNYPNPFNGHTSIQVDIPVESNVSLCVYNTLGKKIRTLFSGRKMAGSHHYVWNGRDDKGTECSSGTYFLKVDAADYHEMKKMLYLR
jgi:PKD repeat protein